MKMKLNTVLKTAIIAGLLVSTAACKKDKKEEVLPNLKGTVMTSLPRYLLQGEKIAFTPKGVTHPENKPMGWYITVSKDKKEVYRDTLKKLNEEKIKEFSYVFPADSVGNYQIQCAAYADGYNTNYSSRHLTVVGPLMRAKPIIINGETVYQLRKNEHASITESGIDFNNGKYFDIENRRYFYHEATEGLYWMQDNLMEPGKGKAYTNEEAMSSIFGRYYSWEEAKTVCPEGWRLPTASEWDALVSRTEELLKSGTEAGQTVPGAWVADARFHGVTMWEYWPANDQGMGDLTNAMKMCMLPVGYANLPADKFDGMFEYAMFWSSDEIDASKARAYGIYNYWKEAKTFSMDKKSHGLSVRCVKEK